MTEEKLKPPAQKRGITVRPLPWLDDLFRAKGAQTFGRPIGPKGTRELTTMVRAAMLLWSLSPDQLHKASLDAIKYHRHDADRAIRGVIDAISAGRKLKSPPADLVIASMNKVPGASPRGRQAKKKGA